MPCQFQDEGAGRIGWVSDLGEFQSLQGRKPKPCDRFNTGGWKAGLSKMRVLRGPQARSGRSRQRGATCRWDQTIAAILARPPQPEARGNLAAFVILEDLTGLWRDSKRRQIPKRPNSVLSELGQTFRKSLNTRKSQRGFPKRISKDGQAYPCGG